MKLGTYPRHRLRAFPVHDSRSSFNVFGNGFGTDSVAVPTLDDEPKTTIQLPGLDALADAIFEDANEQMYTASVEPVVSHAHVSRLNSLLQLDATAGSDLSQSGNQGQDQHKPISGLARNRMHIVKRKTSRMRQWQRPLAKPPDTEPFGEGHRVESYENGARVMKDELGRVVEVSSQTNQQMFITYSKAGFLSAFCLLDPCGNVLLVAEHDERGSIVRGSEGQLQAIGEYMSVGPNGCLTVHRLDGQFWSIDPVLNTFTERRFMVDSQNHSHCLTAIFSDDGFRMMTRFQAVPSEQSSDQLNEVDSSLNWQGSSAKVTLRFYGRDGSMIQFDSDENLESIKPSLVKPAAAKQHLPGKRNNRTAWDAVERYLGFASYRT